MASTLLTAGDGTNGVVVTSGNDNTLTIQTGAAGAKVNAVALDASGNAAVLGTVTQAGIATPRMVLGTAVTTTGGTTQTITGIPSWVKRITLMFNTVSTNGTSDFLVRIGSGSVDTTSYESSSEASGTGATSTTGYIVRAGAAANSYTGIMTLVLVGSNLWVASGVIRPGVTGGTGTGGAFTGYHSTSGALDRIQLTTVSGDTFDGGSINILYEG